MTTFLLFLLLGFLYYIKITIDSKFDGIENDFKELSRKIDALKVTEKLSEKPIAITETSKSSPTIETVKPIIPIAVEKEKKFEKTENIQKYTEEVSSPKPEKAEKKPYIPEESYITFWERFRENNPDLEKFIGENLINKIGILILVLGISYFVKYAIDKDWINEPARVGIGMLSGALLLGVAHKLRQKYAAFSSVFVAGAIAVFYFTIAIAFHSYHLFSQTVAFIIMVVITAFSSLISLSYNRKELAVLSLIGGFAVPFMLSTGEGNYLVLFSYILILNIGILALAYYKKWSVINMLSYVFTVLLYGAWLFKDFGEKTPHYLGALIFGFAFYFVFILINIINNIRTKGVFSATELSILASNNLLFYAAGVFILENFHPELKGLFTTTLGLLNFIAAWFLYKKMGHDKTAVYLLIGLTLTFVTLAVPIQFEGNQITLFWAAEAVILLWLAQKSKINYYRLASIIVHALMTISLLMDWKVVYLGDSSLIIVFNKIFSTGVFAVISLFAACYLLKDEEENQQQFGITFNPKEYRFFISVIGVVIAYLTGLFEVSYQSQQYITGANSAFTLPITYHLIFSAFAFNYLSRIQNTISNQLTNILAIANVLLFTFFFSNFAFYEHERYIATGIHQRIGFYLHYISLVITLFFGYKLYLINKKNPVFEIFQKKYIIWIAAFFIIKIASTELMLHTLVISNSPITIHDIQSNGFYKNYASTDLHYLRNQIAFDQIQISKNQIIKTGFPILWGILAFVFLISGIRKRIKNLRIAALILLGITILKLFLFDISNASETGKIIAFILLGILILIISFVYQKLKILVQDDNQPNTNDETV